MSTQDDILSPFAAGPALIEVVLEHAADALDKRATDGWSVHEILVHLADAEILRALRIRLILANEGVELPVFDQDEWRDRLAYPARDPGIAFSAYGAMVGATAELIAAYGEAAWERTGRHPEEGDLSVRELVIRGANHAREHAEQIRSLLERP